MVSNTEFITLPPSLPPCKVKSTVPWLSSVLKLLQEAQELTQDLIDKVLYIVASEGEFYIGGFVLLKFIELVMTGRGGSMNFSNIKPPI